MDNKQGQWIRDAKNGLNVVFIHGINSSEECWRHKDGSYWPTLLKNESELTDIGIYVFSYRTSLNTGSYSISDIVDSFREYFKLDKLIDSSGIIFVCHSMGGIVTRRFLVNQQSDLIERGLKIGLFLVASPSLGSEYANMLNLISSALGHTQASALKFSQNNVWLNDLDKDFRNLMNGKLRIVGKELIEDLPLFGKKCIFMIMRKKQIVQPFSGARYFGDSCKVPESDHITIATPASRDAVQNRMLVQFIKNFRHESPFSDVNQFKNFLDYIPNLPTSVFSVDGLDNASTWLQESIGKFWKDVQQLVQRVVDESTYEPTIPSPISREKNTGSIPSPILRVKNTRSNGDLIQKCGNAAIYLVDEGKRRHIEDLAQVFKDAPNINSIEEKNDIPEGKPIIRGSVLVTSAAAEAGPVYLIDNYDGHNEEWKKRHILSIDIFNKYQFNQDNIKVVPQARLDKMDDGPDIL